MRKGDWFWIGSFLILVAWIVMLFAALYVRVYEGEREVFFRLNSGWEASVISSDGESVGVEGRSKTYFDASRVEDGELTKDSFYGERLARDSFVAESQWKPGTTYRMTAGSARITATSESGVTVKVWQSQDAGSGAFTMITVLAVAAWVLLVMLPLL